MKVTRRSFKSPTGRSLLSVYAHEDGEITLMDDNGTIWTPLGESVTVDVAASPSPAGEKQA